MGFKLNVFNRLLSLHTCCTDPAADQGARGRSQSPGMTKPPFLRHPFVVPTPSPPPPPPSPSRWLTLQPAEVSCAEGAPSTPALGPEPQRKSAAVHRGNPVLPGVSAQPGTICPGALTQEQRCQGGFPLTCCALQAIRVRPGAGDRSIILESGHDRRGLVYTYCKSLWMSLIQWTN